MNSSLLIKGGRLLDPASNADSVKDVRIAGGAIAAVAGTLSPQPNETVFDAAGLWVCPGFIDIHTHLRDLGQKDKEDIDTGTKAAAAGGFTTVVAMANTEPVVDNANTLSVLLERIERYAHIEVLPVAAVTRGLQGAELTNMSELADMGAVAFSDDGMTVSNLAVLRRALEYARLTGRVVISHAEDRDLSAGGAIQEGRVCTCMGLAGIPAASETAAVAREIEIVRLTKAPYHFTHLSCAGSATLVRRARQDGLPVTADVTPHHLCLTVDDIAGYDTNYKMKPPLRTAADIAALVEALKDGTIEAIATDHAPHSRLDKDTTMAGAAVGITGLETAFSLVHEKLCVNDTLSPLKLIALLTTGPASIINLPQPALAEGLPAHVTIVDPSARWMFDARQGMSRSHNTPFTGKQMVGKVLVTIYGGTPVFMDSERTGSRFSTTMHQEAK